jgi:hypothetical protein
MSSHRYAMLEQPGLASERYAFITDFGKRVTGVTSSE